MNRMLIDVCGARGPNSSNSKVELSVGCSHTLRSDVPFRHGNRPMRHERPYDAFRECIQPAQLATLVLGDSSLAEVTGDGALHDLTFQLTMTSHRQEKRRLDRVSRRAIAANTVCERPLTVRRRKKVGRPDPAVER